MNGSPAVAIAAAIEAPDAKDKRTNAFTSEEGNAPLALLVPTYPITAEATMFSGNTQISAVLASKSQALAPSERHPTRKADAKLGLTERVNCPESA
jgi:hypothetical protein